MKKTQRGSGGTGWIIGPIVMVALVVLVSWAQFQVYQRNHPGATFWHMMFDPEVK